MKKVDFLAKKGVIDLFFGWKRGDCWGVCGVEEGGKGGGRRLVKDEEEQFFCEVAIIGIYDV